jgi:hypothetical protein
MSMPVAPLYESITQVIDGLETLKALFNEFNTSIDDEDTLRDGFIFTDALESDCKRKSCPMLLQMKLERNGSISSKNIRTLFFTNTLRTHETRP